MINQLYHQILGQSAIYIDGVEQINRINRDNNSYILTATIDGKIIGTIQCTVCQIMSFDESRYVFIVNFIVDKLCCFRE